MAEPVKPRFLTGELNERTRRMSQRHEKAVAKGLGGKTTIGSGNKGMKGDVHAGNPDAGQRLMVEGKSTEGRQMTLKLDWLDKVAREALQAGMEPVLHLRFDAAKLQGYTEWACVPWDRLQELLELEAQVRSS